MTTDAEQPDICGAMVDDLDSAVVLAWLKAREQAYRDAAAFDGSVGAEVTRVAKMFAANALQEVVTVVRRLASGERIAASPGDGEAYSQEFNNYLWKVRRELYPPAQP